MLITQFGQPRLEIDLDLVNRLQNPLPGCDVMGLGIDGVTSDPRQYFAGQRVEQGQALDLVVEQFDPQRLPFRFGRIDIDHLATDAIGGAAQFGFVAGILQFGETAQQGPLLDHVAPDQMQHHAEIRCGLAEAVNRGNRGDDNGVAPLDERLGRG